MAPVQPYDLSQRDLDILKPMVVAGGVLDVRNSAEFDQANFDETMEMLLDSLMTQNNEIISDYDRG